MGLPWKVKWAPTILASQTHETRDVPMCTRFRPPATVVYAKLLDAFRCCPEPSEKSLVTSAINCTARRVPQDAPVSSAKQSA
eukprot:1175481-Karenia_brevis.AAC.1